MWNYYLGVSAEHPLLAAFAQFLILGTIGEILSVMVRTGQCTFPFSRHKFALKLFGWGVLGIYIKLMFVIASAGFVGLIGYGVFSESSRYTTAFITSVLMNIMLGPSMMLIHRLIDNAIDRVLGEKALGWVGVEQAMGTLVWLWIPLHTITFTQPKEIRVGIAAVLSLVLGVVMGYAKKPRVCHLNPTV